VEITHGRVQVTGERAAKIHGPVEIPQGRVNGRRRASRDNTRACGNSTRPCGNSNLQIKLQIYTRVRDKSWSEDPHGRVEIPHGRVDARFYVYKRPNSEQIWDTLGGDFSRLVPNFKGAAARVSEMLWRIITTRISRGFSCLLYLVYFFGWHCIAPWGAKPLVGSWTREP